MNIKKHIPNLLTLGNLFSGSLATIYAVQGEFLLAGLFVVLGIFFDFLDGFVARLLKVSGELGKQLDSLADMVTSGVVPGIIMAKMIQENLSATANSFETSFYNVSIIGLVVTLAACYRLAKFNIDTRQTDSFIGLPTPAMSLFIISLPLIKEFSEIEFVINLINNNYFLITITVVLSYLMNAEIPLFSLKFKDYNFKNNWIKYVFLCMSLLLVISIEYISIPIIIILYVILSLYKKPN